MGMSEENRKAIAKMFEDYVEKQGPTFDHLVERGLIAPHQLETLKNLSSSVVHYHFWPHQEPRVMELDDSCFGWMMLDMITTIASLKGWWSYYFEHEPKPDKGLSLSARINPLRLTKGVNMSEMLCQNIETGVFKISTLPNRASAGNLNELAGLYFQILSEAFPEAPVLDAQTAFAEWSTSFGNDLLSKETRAALSPRVAEKYKPYRAALIALTKWFAALECKLNNDLKTAALKKKEEEKKAKDEIQTERLPDREEHDPRVEQASRILLMLRNFKTTTDGIWRFEQTCRLVERAATGEAESGEMLPCESGWFAVALDIFKDNPKGGWCSWSEFTPKEQTQIATAFLGAAKAILFWLDRNRMRDAYDQECSYKDIGYVGGTEYNLMQDLAAYDGGPTLDLVKGLLFSKNERGEMSYDTTFFRRLERDMQISPEDCEVDEAEELYDVEEVSRYAEEMSRLAFEETHPGEEYDALLYEPWTIPAPPTQAPAPLKEYDEERYGNLPLQIAVCVRIPRCAARLEILCRIIAEGVDKALMGEPDFDFYRQPWFVACLELLCETPNFEVSRDLTISDTMSMAGKLTDACGALCKILVIYHQQHTEDPKDENLPRFYDVVKKQIFEPNTQIEEKDGQLRRKTVFPQQFFFGLDSAGRLQYGNCHFQALRAACGVKSRREEFKKLNITPDEQRQVESMALEAQGDSDENTKWNYIRIKPYAEYAEGFLQKFTAEPMDILRYTQLQKATSVGKLVFQYIQQYCVPYTRYAIGRSEENKRDFDIDGEFKKLIGSFEQLLAALVESSDGGENATAAQKLGREVIARLRARIADPLDELSIAEQEKFRFDVSKLRQLIVDSADEVRKADERRECGAVGPVSMKRPKEANKEIPVPPHPSGMTTEDAVAELKEAIASGTAKTTAAIKDGVRSLKEALPKKGELSDQQTDVPRSGAVELLQKVKESVKGSLEAAKKEAREAAYGIFNNKEAKDAIRKLFHGGFECGQIEAAELGRLWYETRTATVDYLRFLSRRGVKGADRAIECFEARGVWEISEKLAGNSRGASQLRIEVTKELYCCFVDRPLVKEGDFTAAVIELPDWSKWPKVGVRFKCDVKNNFANIVDFAHMGNKDFPLIDAYLELAESAQKVVQLLIAASANKNPDDWWIKSKIDGKAFIQAFQESAPAARRFYNDQIQVGTNNDHKGKWRILPDVMFKDRYLKNHPKTDPLKDS